MSNGDSIIFNLDEQYTSPDLNQLQELWARYQIDVAAFGGSSIQIGQNSLSIPGDNMPTAVIGGLSLAISGSDAVIAAGAIVQPWGALPASNPPVSGQKLGFLPTATVMAGPAPVSDTWYLIEAEALETTDAGVNINIWNGLIPGAFVLTPNTPKRKRFNVALTWLAGSSAQIPSPTATKVPLFAVFRPAGGGAISAAQVIDMRPRLMPIPPSGNVYALLENSWETNQTLPTATTIRIATRVMSPSGELFMRPPFGSSPTFINPLDAAYVDPGAPAPAANEWWYLYLAPLSGVGRRGRPRHCYANYVNEGILVFAKSSPGMNRTNAISMNSPAPFGNYPIAGGTAVCFGALKRNAANNGWNAALCLNDRVALFVDMATGVTAFPANILTALGGTNPLPASARSFDVLARATSAPAAGSTFNFGKPGGGDYGSQYATRLNASIDMQAIAPDNTLGLGVPYEVTRGAGTGGTFSFSAVAYRF